MRLFFSSFLLLPFQLYVHSIILFIRSCHSLPIKGASFSAAFDYRRLHQFPVISIILSHLLGCDNLKYVEKALKNRPVIGQIV